MRLFFCFFTSFLSFASAASEILVFTDSIHSVYNIPANAKVIKLDAAQILQSELSVNLPIDRKQAESVAKTRIENMDGSFREKLQDVVDAWGLGITKIPAVMIDQYVVYGESDVEKAVLQIKKYRNQRYED